VATGRWLLYGANGYTGALIVEEAKRRGISPIIAGRREQAITPLAQRHGLEHRVFPLDDRAALERALGEVDAVLLAAGPFSITCTPVLAACLRTGTHYLDITGEIPVFEQCFARDPEARRAAVTVMAGVGFDVVPSDCLAVSVAERLPDAVRLELAFASSRSPSRGTTMTMVEHLHAGGAVRRGGRMVNEPVAARERTIPFRDKPRHAVSIPWGDVSTAYRSTGIPDVTVYTAMPEARARRLRRMRPLLRLTSFGPVKALLRAAVDRWVTGPSEEVRRAVSSQLWARAEDAQGNAVEGVLTTPEGYTLTAMTAVECAERVVRGEASPGTVTPGMAFGGAFIAGFRGCALEVGGAPVAGS
jgi:short subunit dehydrogenase-like uncharacterized protein